MNLKFCVYKAGCKEKCPFRKNFNPLHCGRTSYSIQIDVKNGLEYLARSFHIICTEKIAILLLRCNVFDSKMLIFYTESFVKKNASGAYFAFLFWCQQYVKSFILDSTLIHRRHFEYRYMFFYCFGLIVNHIVNSICQIQFDHIIMILFFF